MIPFSNTSFEHEETKLKCVGGRGGESAPGSSRLPDRNKLDILGLSLNAPAARRCGRDCHPRPLCFPQRFSVSDFRFRSVDFCAPPPDMHTIMIKYTLVARHLKRPLAGGPADESLLRAMRGRRAAAPLVPRAWRRRLATAAALVLLLYGHYKVLTWLQQIGADEYEDSFDAGVFPWAGERAVGDGGGGSGGGGGGGGGKLVGLFLCTGSFVLVHQKTCGEFDMGRQPEPYWLLVHSFPWTSG